MSKKNVVTVLFVAVILYLTSGARACLKNTVEIEHDGYGASGMAELWGGGLNGANRHAGVYMLDKSGGAGEGDLWDDGWIGVFCIELSQSAPSYPKTYDVVMPQDAQNPTTFLGEKIGSEKAEYLSELWGRFFDEAWVTSESFTAEQNIAAEAFAVAVWEIIYEDMPESPTTWDVAVDGTAGPLGFRCDDVDISLANGMLHSLDGTGPKADLRAFTNGCSQDYIVEVPEPATILLLGLSSLALIHRKKK
ncbi:MAG TPA: PEP-CTERM sorting domain-containing protein [Sedimentisphaerales bacterium]|nr:PEP-CTERM sorting domain-containing protein [Sedimentisphaerales bacterium]